MEEKWLFLCSPGLHPMDCTDVVIAQAKGNLYRVGDFYTRDRSTPVMDEYLGGVNSLTAALAWEKDDTTTMIFRRKLTSEAATFDKV